MHNVVRIYPDGDKLSYTRTKEELPIHNEDQSLHRPHCAIFIDGECIQTGTLSMDQLVKIGRELASSSK